MNYDRYLQPFYNEAFSIASGRDFDAVFFLLATVPHKTLNYKHKNGSNRQCYFN
jgi:hypothetical protein